jgi:hypothetical protein
MIEQKVHRSYTQYATITREQAFSRGFDGEWLLKGYDARKARELLECSNAVAVDFCRPQHNTSGTRYIPPQGYIVYLKNGSGRSVRVITREGEVKR